jgi:hypothetical protein
MPSGLLKKRRFVHVSSPTAGEEVRSYFTRRYLEYLTWLENGSATNLTLYYALRIPAIILAALVPALVALNLDTTGRVITVLLGVVVAAATAVEHFLTSGQRWRHYRGSVELLKSEGWLFLNRRHVFRIRLARRGFPRFRHQSRDSDAERAT